jgi:hypothetical protein
MRLRTLTAPPRLKSIFRNRGRFWCEHRNMHCLYMNKSNFNLPWTLNEYGYINNNNVEIYKYKYTHSQFSIRFKKMFPTIVTLGGNSRLRKTSPWGDCTDSMRLGNTLETSWAKSSLFLPSITREKYFLNIERCL